MFLSEVVVNHLKNARGEIWPKRSEKKQKKNTNKIRDKKSAINIKLMVVLLLVLLIYEGQKSNISLKSFELG